MRIRQQLVRLWKRPSKDGQSYTYYLRYFDLAGKRRSESLGHSDERKAEKQRAKKEKELGMGFCQPGSMRLQQFLEDSLTRTGDQIRPSTKEEYQSAMNDFIAVIGNVDFRQITLKHGERYRQVCLDRGNSPATISKKLTEIKAFFELAVQRQQIDENPFKYIKKPKSPKWDVHIYTDGQCEQMLKVAVDIVKASNSQFRPKWDLLILFALSTALRRGEILNCVWEDIDLAEQTIQITPKENTATTWEWRIKDNERRVLPLTEELTQLLIDHQSQQPEGYPYVFVPPARYDHIQKLRAEGKWKYSNSRLRVVCNFRRDFQMILSRARVKKGTFHDLRKTAICKWFAQGMSEFDVMKLAGHSDFSTTHKFYMAVADDLVDRAREATARGLCQKLAQLGMG